MTASCTKDASRLASLDQRTEEPSRRNRYCWSTVTAVLLCLLPLCVYGGARASDLPAAPPHEEGTTEPVAAAETRGLGMVCREFRGIEMQAAPVSDVAVIRVLFATGSHELTPEATQMLTPLGHALASEELRPYCFRIEGHTDSAGSDAYNKRLSERRARSVTRFLTDNFEIGEDKLVAVGFGEGEPIASNQTAEGRQRNRRVQVTNLGTSIKRTPQPRTPEVHDADRDAFSAEDIKGWLLPK
jgi:outer membrane protein OmpA-like peptidoglycan-associated protein